MHVQLGNPSAAPPAHCQRPHVRSKPFRYMAAAGSLLAALVLCLLAACANRSRDGGGSASITLATTTSTRDSGLLDDLLPRFREATGIEVKVVAVGTGQALEIGKRGDADVLLTHARRLEEAFVREGYGERRIPVMSNDFVLLGPSDDPAGVRADRDMIEAFRRVARAEALFVSRGDRSGTHVKEESIWNEAGIDPSGSWYIEAGQGMAGTLRLASEKRAYVLSDRGTYLAQRRTIDLEIVSQGDARLRNEYAVMVVNSRRHPHVHVDGARRFVAFLLEEPTQQWIGRFGVERYGEPLFRPAVRRSNGG